MVNPGDSNELFDALSGKFSMDNVIQSVNYFNTLQRYTGTEESDIAAKYIINKMHEYGTEVHEYEYNAYVSRPLNASIHMGAQHFKAIAAVYSGDASQLQGEIVYIKDSKQLAEHGRLNKDAHNIAKGKVILINKVEDGFAKIASDAQALAVIQIQESKEDLIHHSTVGTVWGTPCLNDIDKFPYIPYVFVTYSDGQEMITNIMNKNYTVSITVVMDNSVKKSMMPVARISGKSDKFVLISAHYDSWYEGITDNAISDAILIEYARIFSENKTKLNRSIVIGWWSGHSDGRYAGSTWYCDNLWEDLSKNCIAHFNIDLAGCKNSDQIRARTTLMEGEIFTSQLIKKYTGNDTMPSIFMPRAADQSFWGAKIPISIMLKYEPLPKNCDFSCPSGGVWWHTDCDTIDKMDRKITARDMLINAEMICSVLNSKHIPIQIVDYITQISTYLYTISNSVSDTNIFEPVFKNLANLKRKVISLYDSPEFERTDNDDIVKYIGGELVRLTYSYSSQYYQDSAAKMERFPLIKKSLSILENSNEEDIKLFAMTDLIRQRNRLAGQIDHLAMILDNFLFRLRTEALNEPSLMGSESNV